MKTVRPMLGALVMALLGVACSKEAPPAAEQSKSPATQAPVAEAPAAAPANEAAPTVPAAAVAPAAEPQGAGQAKFSEETFELTIQPKGAYKAGQAGEAEIVLLAKAPFHVNDKYPYKFKAKEGPGLKLSAPVVGKDAVKLEQQRATMRVAFTPVAAGKHQLAGQFSFSVCTDDKCLIEKRDLALEVSAE